MAFDRYDPRRPRDERSRWRDDDDRRGRFESREHGYRDDQRDYGRSGRRDERGFFERAGDEISSWFEGDRSHRDERGHGRHHGGDYGRSSHRDRDDHSRGGWFEEAKSWFGGSDRDHRHGYDRDRERGHRRHDDDRAQPMDWSTSQRDYSRSGGRQQWGGGDRDFGRGRDFDRERGGYRPMTGDYGRFEGRGMPSGGGSDFSRNRGEWDYDPNEGRDRFEGRSKWDRDDYRRTSFAGSAERGDRNRERGFEQDRERGAMFGRDRDDELSHRGRDFDEDRGRRALFEDEDDRRDRGPHMLDRSFSGTYR